MSRRFWVETLGCPKNQVDSDKLTGTLLRDGLVPAPGPDDADLVVVNTCAFIEDARQESIDVVLALADRKRDGAELVVTGCLAERYGDPVSTAAASVSTAAGLSAAAGVPVAIGLKPVAAGPVPTLDLLELPRP